MMIWTQRIGHLQIKKKVILLIVCVIQLKTHLYTELI